MVKEDLLHDLWLKETGSAQNVVQKSINCLSNQLQTDLFTVENAGQRNDLQSSIDSNKKICRNADFFCHFFTQKNLSTSIIYFSILIK